MEDLLDTLALHLFRQAGLGLCQSFISLIHLGLGCIGIGGDSPGLLQSIPELLPASGSIAALFDQLTLGDQRVQRGLIRIADLGGQIGQADLSRGGKDIGIIGLSIQCNQTDILGLDTIKLDNLPAAISDPGAGLDGLKGLAIIGNLDGILGDGTVAAALTGLIAQAVDNVVLA